MKTYYFLIFLLVFGFLFGQTKDFDAVEFLSKYFPENYNENSIYLLENLYENKIDLNLLKLSDKSILFFVNEKLIDEIINYRNKTGKYLSVKDLYNIPDINPNKLKLLIPFITISSCKQSKKINIKDFLPELNFRGKFTEDFYSPFRQVYYSKIFVKNKYYRFSILYNNPSGLPVNFENFSVKITPSSPLSEIVTGKYSINFGFGLSLWGPYKMFKGIYYKAIRKSNARLKMHKAVSFKNVLRGAAIKTKYDFFSTKLFLSQNNLLNIKNHFGVILQYFNKNRKIDFLYHKIISKKNNRKCFSSYSFSLSFSFSKWKYENEINYYNNSISQIHSIKFYPSDDLTFFYLIRSYNKQNHQLFANPIREYSAKKNEFGQIFCLEFNFRKQKLILFLDKFQNSSKQNPNIKLHGNEFALRFIDKSFYFTKTIFDLKYEKKESFKFSLIRQHIVFDKILKIKLKTIYSVPNKINIYSRIDYHKTIAPYSGTGYSLTTGFNLKVFKNFRLKGRFTTFQIPQSSSIIYIYEEDLPGAFLTKSFSGRGIYWYFLAQIKIRDDLRLTFKYSEQTTGNNYYQNNFKTLKRNFKIQADFKI